MKEHVALITRAVAVCAASIIVSAALPVAYLVMEQVSSTSELAKQIGPYYSGIATYLLSAAAMYVGSKLKPGTIPSEIK